MFLPNSSCPTDGLGSWLPPDTGFTNVSSAVHPLLVILGLLINLLAAFILNRCSFRQAATTFLLLALACLDIVALSVTSIPLWLGTLKVHPTSHTICRILAYLTRGSRSCQASAVALLALERLVAAAARGSSGRLAPAWQRQQSVWALALSCVICLLAYIPVFVYFKLDSFVCKPDNEGFLEALRWLDLVLHALLPAGFVVVYLSVMFLSVCACQQQSKNAVNMWADKLATGAGGMFLLSQSPSALLTVVSLEASAHRCLLRAILTLCSQLHLVATPLTYLLCSRFRRDLGTAVARCLGRQGSGGMSIQPRDSVMVTHGRF